mmetsp:Transcript_14938/g.37249  ORF Transcript_14938/g.37249 Transcript_14938/m.37249 type:complete len:233 (-) Transcript_14938:44-742(-)
MCGRSSQLAVMQTPPAPGPHAPSCVEVSGWVSSWLSGHTWGRSNQSLRPLLLQPWWRAVQARHCDRRQSRAAAPAAVADTHPPCATCLPHHPAGSWSCAAARQCPRLAPYHHPHACAHDGGRGDDGDGGGAPQTGDGPRCQTPPRGGACACSPVPPPAAPSAPQSHSRTPAAASRHHSPSGRCHRLMLQLPRCLAPALQARLPPAPWCLPPRLRSPATAAPVGLVPGPVHTR